MIGGYRFTDIHAMSWRGFFMMIVLTLLIGTVLLLLSNIVIKAFPSLSKKKVMSDIHYDASYNQKYLVKDSLMHRLRHISLWKLLAVVLILIFVFTRYFKIAFNDWF